MIIPQYQNSFAFYGGCVLFIKAKASKKSQIFPKFAKNYGKIKVLFPKEIIMKIAVRLLCLVLLCAIAIIALSPYYQLYRLKSAYEQGDYAKIVQAVDFVNLRQGLKTQLYDKASHVMQETPKELEILGIDEAKLNNLAKMMIDKTVDSTITQDNAMRLAQGRTDFAQDEMMGAVLLGGLAGQNDDKTVDEPTEQTNTDNKYQLAYCGVNCFSIKTKVAGKDIDVRMTRHQLITWKIDNVILP